MPKLSAGLLLFRHGKAGAEVLLVHPGGPFFVRKDAGAWSIPKGEYEPDEAPLDAARREFEEETGYHVNGRFEPLGEVTLKSGKVITAWAVEGDADPAEVTSNNFTLEWPPRSGREREFPEVDRAAWFGLDAAREKIHPAQEPFLDRLASLLPQMK